MALRLLKTVLILLLIFFLQIHRRELVDDGRSSITGSFVLEESLGEPAQFVIYTHSPENPLLKAVRLVSPSQKIYTGRSDSSLQFRLMRIITNINEVKKN